jgi:hypothetical protein
MDACTSLDYTYIHAWIHTCVCAYIWNERKATVVVVGVLFLDVLVCLSVAVGTPNRRREWLIVSKCE